MTEAANQNQQALRASLRQIKPRWDRTRTDENLEATHRALRRSQVRLRTGASAGLLTVAACALLLVSRDPAPAVEGAAGKPLAKAAAPLVLEDGSTVELLSASTRLQVTHASPSEQRVALSGVARFQVQTNPERRFVVQAGEVRVEVIGTEFVVERQENGARVEVLRGRVRVLWEEGERELVAGESGRFPPAGRSGAARTGTKTVEASSLADASAAPSPSPSSAGVRYGEHAQKRRYREAYAVLRANPAVAGSSAHELMLAADVARLSGHSEAALVYLRRVMAEFPGSSQASLAAFTLGRSLMGMGRTEEANQAFAKAGSLAPQGTLAEDALARRVEAAHQAGDRANARRLAEEYLAKYPKGQRRALVRRLGGIP